MANFDLYARLLKSLLIFPLLAGLLGTSLARAGDIDSSDATEPATPIAKIQGFTDRASELVMRAMGLLGIRYKHGGSTPEKGLDCSGLVHYVFKEAWGTDVPRTAEGLSRAGQQVDTQNLQPGDLVFYNTLKRGFSHVGIYLGDNRFIHAPSTGGQVRIESMDVSYWKARFNGARRISDPQDR